MECAICYEKFFVPNNKKEFDENIKKFKEKHNNLIDNYLNYIITPNHNTTYKCPTEGCNCIICNNCWKKITSNKINNFNSLDSEDDYFDNIPSMYDIFKCPYCRLIDYKNYMKDSVLCELQRKILGEDEWINLLYDKVCNDD